MFSFVRSGAVMCPKGGSGLRDKEFKVIHDEDGMPIMIMDKEPFYEDRFEDCESGHEILQRYYLVFDFIEGSLMAEVTQTSIDLELGGEFSYGHVPLDQLGKPVVDALIASGRLEGMRYKVLQVAREMLDRIAQITGLPSGAFPFQTLETRVSESFEQAIKQVAQEAERDG